MSDFEKFKGGGLQTTSSYLPPDYTGSPSEDDDDDELLEEDDAKIEELLDKQHKTNISNMGVQDTPFGRPSSDWGSSNNWRQPGATSPTPSWGNTSWGTTSQQQSTQPGWMNNNQPPSWQQWGSGNNTPGWGNMSKKVEKIHIDRSKRVLVIDLLDGLVETFQSNGVPGLLPRGIYDLRLRFEVWNKISAINPEYLFIIVPKMLLANGYGSWELAINYVVSSLLEYLRLPSCYCQILLLPGFNQRGKEFVLSPLTTDTRFDTKSIVYVGVYSGLDNQSDRDKQAAEKAGIDYIDIVQLLNNMY